MFGTLDDGANRGGEALGRQVLARDGGGGYSERLEPLGQNGWSMIPGMATVGTPASNPAAAVPAPQW